MADFLSDEWIAALGDACPAAVGGAEPDRLTIEPVVADVPGRGEVRYRIVIGAQCSVGPAGAEREPADVRLHTDYETAVALARGETNAQAALASGRLRLAGDLPRLAAHAGALARLDDLFVAVRSSTVFPRAVFPPSGPAVPGPTRTS